MNSKQKGKRGELELAKILRDYGFDNAKRGQQFKGGTDSPDVIGIEGVHIECKRVEKLNIYDAMEQAEHDCGTNIPTVMWRKNNKKWLVTLNLNDFLMMIRRLKDD